MLIIFLIVAFLRTLHGVPIPVSTNIDTLTARESIVINSDGANTRSEYDLVKACVLTVLACVWSAAHPNIPGPRDSTWTRFKRRVVIMICALVSTELMAMWALRQWNAARKIAEDYNSEVLGLPRKENISLRSRLWNLLKESWASAKELFINLPRIAMGRRNGQAWRAAAAPYATLEDPTEAGEHDSNTKTGAPDNTDRTEKLSLRMRLSDWLRTSLWVSPKAALHELFVELPKERTLRAPGQPWTTTHGFFIQMGGFLLYSHDYPARVLTYDDLKDLLLTACIDAPVCTEHDLHDRSKGDTISKGVVVLQTTWFVVQCVARLCSGLPLSELEVVTLGFAMLNGVVYAIWWDKPQGVELAIFVPLKEEERGKGGRAEGVEAERSSRCEDSAETRKLEDDDASGVAANLQALHDVDVGAAGSAGEARERVEAETVARPLGYLETDGLILPETRGIELHTLKETESMEISVGKPGESPKRQESAGGDSADIKSNPSADGARLEGRENDEDVPESSETHTPSGHLETDGLVSPKSTLSEDQTPAKTGWLRRKLHKDRSSHHWPTFIFIRVPYRFLHFLFRPLWKIAGTYIVPKGAHRVPMFYTDPRGDEPAAGYALCTIGIAVGAVHLLAWSSAFPSHTERLLWRLSTLVVVATPILLIMTSGLANYQDTRLGGALVLVVAIPAVFAIPLYVIARFMLIILAFLSLQALPLSAFVTIPWTSFIPHL